ncbi:MAG: hypothetical protein MK080_06860 [Opitutales bacterium]|nr:hypothetical protein [Opitutales bacterium]NRA25667.1 hypothetical protein [Opitutales bacterium]
MTTSTSEWKLSERAILYPYTDEEQALRMRSEDSPWFLPLSGNWKFALYLEVESVDLYHGLIGVDNEQYL